MPAQRALQPGTTPPSTVRPGGEQGVGIPHQAQLGRQPTVEERISLLDGSLHRVFQGCGSGPGLGAQAHPLAEALHLPGRGDTHGGQVGDHPGKRALPVARLQTLALDACAPRDDRRLGQSPPPYSRTHRKLQVSLRTSSPWRRKARRSAGVLPSGVSSKKRRQPRVSGIGLDHRLGQLARGGRDHRLDRGLRVQRGEGLAGEVDHELALARVQHVGPASTDARGDRAPAEHARLGVPGETQAIGQLQLLAMVGRPLRRPVGDDVVVALRGARDLDQLHHPFAPVADWLYQSARAILVVRLQVLIAAEVPIALEETEGPGILDLEVAHPQPDGIDQRAPDPLAQTGFHQQAVGVVDLGSEVVHEAVGILAVEEHAGQRGQAELLDAFAEKESRFHVEDGLAAGLDDEAVGTGDALAVEQGEDLDLGRVLGGLAHPELAEHRELLLARESGIDGQPTGRDPVVQILTDCAEVARP